MKLYNYLTGQKEELKTINPKEVLMYVCGITPYDTTHLGHAFTYVFFDTLKRYLEFQGYKVKYTQNVTDIDDDILKEAARVKKNWVVLGNLWTKRFTEDMHTLNVEDPTNFVKATQFIPVMIQIIQDLLDKKIAYPSGGNIYFDISKFPDYGKLSKLSPTEMLPFLKERGGDPEDPNKKNPLDFLLWQGSKPGEPSWDTPWVKGRPGWHIECSSMIYKTLGPQIDIHGGGYDLIFPHHESEIAQSESFTGKSPFSKFWLYTAMVEYHEEKMSKSLGNLVMVKDLLKKYSGTAIRWVLLSHHYREPWEFKMEELDKADQTIKKVKASLSGKIDVDIPAEILAALDNDMDTPKALELLQQNPIKAAFKLLGFNF